MSNLQTNCRNFPNILVLFSFFIYKLSCNLPNEFADALKIKKCFSLQTLNSQDKHQIKNTIKYKNHETNLNTIHKETLCIL